MPTLTDLRKLFVDLEIDEIANTVTSILKNHSAIEILTELSDAMMEVGRLYEEKVYYLPELVLAGESMETAMEILNPLLSKSDKPRKGKIVAATVQGDLHDIGKNIAITLLTAAGYEIIDLGKDVPTERIIEIVKLEHPDIVALSSLLTMTVSGIQEVHEALVKEGLRDRITMICGGAPLNQELAEKLGADYACEDAMKGIQICDKIMAK